MQIFLSYASEDQEIAEEVELALTGLENRVFLDKESLPPGGDYHARIRSAIQQSDIFVFLISRHSVRAGSYALTELKYARSKWPHPKDKVVPVLVSPTDLKTIPAYLKAVTMLQPEGNVAAEVAATVEALKEQLEEKELTASKAPALHEVDYLVQAEEDLESQGASPEVVALLKNSIAVGLFLRDVVTRGEHGKAYKTLVAKEEYRASPSAEYLDEQGRKCRNVRTSKRVGSRWIETPDATFAWDKGEWRGITSAQ